MSKVTLKKQSRRGTAVNKTLLTAQRRLWVSKSGGRTRRKSRGVVEV